MNKFRNYGVAALAGMLVLSLVVGCAGGSRNGAPGKPSNQTQSGSGERPRVRLGSGVTQHFSMLMLAEEMGLFEEAGVDVTYDLFTSGSAAVESMAAGELDMVGSGDMPGIRVWDTGLGKAILHLSRDNLNGFIAKKEIKSASDLAGSTIATRLGATGAFVVDQVLRSGGISPDQVTIVNMEPADMVVAMDKGEIDAFGIWEPFISKSLEMSGDRVHNLIWADNRNMLTVSNEFLRDNREAVERVVGAIVKAGEWYHASEENMRKGQDIIAQRLKEDPEDNRNVMGTYQFLIKWDDESYGYYERMAQWMTDQGTLENEFSWKQFVDLGPLKKAAPHLIVEDRTQ